MNVCKKCGKPYTCVICEWCELSPFEGARALFWVCPNHPNCRVRWENEIPTCLDCEEERLRQQC